MILVALAYPCWLRPEARRAWASLRWPGVISLIVNPFLSLGMKCQLPRSSSLKSKVALAFCPESSDARNLFAAAAISSAGGLANVGVLARQQRHKIVRVWLTGYFFMKRSMG